MKSACDRVERALESGMKSSAQQVPIARIAVAMSGQQQNRR